MARAVDGREAGHGRAVEVGAGRGHDPGGEGRGVELVVGRQDERGADQRRALGRHVPGRGELLVDGQRRERLAPSPPRSAGAACARRSRASRARSSTQLGWSQRAAAGSSTQAAIDRRERGRGQPGLAQRRDHRRQVRRRRTAARRIPQERRDLARARRCAPAAVASQAAIIKTAVLDQGERRFEHRRAEIERVVGDRLGLAADVAAALQPHDVVGAVAPLAAGRRPPPSAAARGSHRRRASPPTRRAGAPLPRNSAIPSP